MTDLELDGLKAGDLLHHAERGLCKVLHISQHKDYALGTLTVLLQVVATHHTWRTAVLDLLHTNWQRVRLPIPLEEIRL